MYPDFDVRNYGYSLLSKFLNEYTTFKLINDNNTVTVELVDNSCLNREIEDYVIEVLKKRGKKGILLRELGKIVHSRYKNFKVRDYGYSTFKKYVQDIKDVEISESKTHQKMAIYQGE